MDAWSVRYYQRPYLAIEPVERESEGCTIAVQTAYDRVEIACESPALAREVSEGLERLRDPADSFWSVVLAEDSSGSWRQLVSRLDELSFVDDAAPESAGVILQQERCRISRDVADTAACILDRLGSARRASVADNTRRLFVEVDRLAREQSCAEEPDGSDVYCKPPAARALDVLLEPNFYVATLVWQGRYLRHAFPAALVAMRAVLLSVLRALEDHLVDKHLTDFDSPLWLGGLYEERDLRAHLTALADLLVRSVGADAARYCLAPRSSPSARSGIAFMLDAERATRSALGRLGDGRYLSAIREVAPGASALMVGCHVEEYHVTRRFVEILTPMLRKRLSSGVRRLMFRYYAEEEGHESLELTTCLALGVSEAALAKSVPLPLNLAFVDVFTHLAEVDPIGFMASVMVTEGMLGDLLPVNKLLTDVGHDIAAFRDVSGRHKSLNTELNHKSIARLLLSQVAAVPTDVQQRALSHLLFVVELNHRTWDGLYDFYAADPKLALHGWLSCRLPTA